MYSHRVNIYIRKMFRKLAICIVLLTSVFLLTACKQDDYRHVEYIDINCSGGYVGVGEILIFEVVIIPWDASNQGYTLSIDDPSIIDFNAENEVMGLTVGTTWINVHGDEGHFNNCSVTVTPAP